MENQALLASTLEGLLYETPAHLVTNIFLWALLVVFLIAFALSIAGFGRRFVIETPTLLTSLGILGTFVGIVIGLMHFDPQNIDGSISNLLAGLKSAFVTSLAGMGGAIVFKIFTTTPLAALNRRQKSVGPVGPEAILKALVDNREQLEGLRSDVRGSEETSLIGQFRLFRSDTGDHHKQLLSSISELKSALTGTEETSLVGQIKLARGDANDRHKQLLGSIEEDRERLDQFADKLWQELEAFAEMLSKSATEQVMNALKEVITDFNKNLTEQFGDNFKALDASVQKLVQWQENYRIQLEEMTAQYAQGVTAITKTEGSVTKISEESKQIPIAMDQLKSVLDVNQKQLVELEKHLKAFQEMKEHAVAAVPEIRAQVQKTVDDVAASVLAANEHYTGLLDRSENYILAHDEKTRDLLSRFVTTTDEGLDTLKGGLENSTAEIQKAITESAISFGQDVQKMLGNATEEVTNSVQVASEHYRKLLDNSDAYLEAHDQKTHELLDSFVKTTEAGIKNVKDGLDSSASAVKTAIITGAEEFDNSVQRLQGNLTSTSDQIANQSEQIRQQLQDTLSDLNERVRSLMVDLSEQSQGVTSTIKEAGKQILKDTQATQVKVTESINQMQARLESSVEEVAAAQTRSMTKSLDGLEEQMRQAVAQTGEGVNKQLSAIDQAMQQEIERVMTEMGRALAQISGQFTKDYSALVNAMSDLVSKVKTRPTTTKRS